MAATTHKRLLVACDGTWVNSDNGFVRDNYFKFWQTTGHLATSSNVTRLCRAVLPETKEGIQQVTYYQGGLGSANSMWSYLFGGYLGAGIDENIREAYAFICNNYTEGDEIVLVGFSRGAFTARSIGGLISSIGILTKRGLGAFYPIYKDWEYQADKNYKPQFGTNTWPTERPRFNEPAYLQKLRAAGLTSEKIPPIKAIGVWDTVGSLGVPTMKLFGITLHKDVTHEYSFVNTEVAPNVEHAYQALALDERRTPFSPTMWECPSDLSNHALKELKQTWFPGVHASVGGGYDDTSISDITLAWMITQLSAHLDFDESYMPWQRSENEAFYKSKNVPVRPWAMGLIPYSAAGFLNTMTGRSTRTPGEYHPTDPMTGHALSRPMTSTNEFIHPSVRYRMEQKGAGVAKDKDDKVGQGTYKPAALADWVYRHADDPEAAKVGGDEWFDYGKWIVERKGGKKTYIVEEKIEEGTAEMALMEGWPQGSKGILAKL